MKIKQWIEERKDREQLRLVVVEAKGHPGLWCRVEGRKEGRTCKGPTTGHTEGKLSPKFSRDVI
jgi:hypothetical protein